MRVLFTILSLFFVVACVKNTLPDTTPSCIKQAIKTGQIDSFAIGRILSYSFQGDTVYLMEPISGSIAIQTPVYDKKCNLICTVGGLISPNLTLCKGDIFSNKAIFINTVWKR